MIDGTLGFAAQRIAESTTEDRWNGRGERGRAEGVALTPIWGMRATALYIESIDITLTHPSGSSWLQHMVRTPAAC